MLVVIPSNGKAKRRSVKDPWHGPCSELERINGDASDGQETAASGHLHSCAHTQTGIFDPRYGWHLLSFAFSQPSIGAISRFSPQEIVRFWNSTGFSRM